MTTIAQLTNQYADDATTQNTWYKTLLTNTNTNQQLLLNIKNNKKIYDEIITKSGNRDNIDGIESLLDNTVGLYKQSIFTSVTYLIGILYMLYMLSTNSGSLSVTTMADP
jgi:hypothetical protein